MRLLNWLSRRRFPYEPLITVEISRSRLLNNLNEFRKLSPDTAVAPVLKSNAYGHGLLEVAKVLESIPGIPFFVVDSYFEAVALRARHIRTPILIIGYTRPETIRASRLRDVSFTVTSLDTLEAICKSHHPVSIHMKVDTGMHRQGILLDEIPRALEIIKDHRHIVLDGVCTHLSDTDNQDETFTQGQIHVWNAAARQFKQAFPGVRYIHAVATDGSRFSREIEGNVMRLGIGLYGLSESQIFRGFIHTQPVLTMKTLVTGVKKIHPGETVGYGNTFKAMNDTTIATVPVGYFEGVDRRLSNNGLIRAGGVLCPIVGRVSMNITTIDVSKVPNAAIGMPVTVISADEADPNSIKSIAEKVGAITYEGAVRIPAHLKRIVVD